MSENRIVCAMTGRCKYCLNKSKIQRFGHFSSLWCSAFALYSARVRNDFIESSYCKNCRFILDLVQHCLEYRCKQCCRLANSGQCKCSFHWPHSKYIPDNRIHNYRGCYTKGWSYAPSMCVHVCWHSYAANIRVYFLYDIRFVITIVCLDRISTSGNI